MNIGEVSDYLKITKKAINLYEEKGLLRPNKNSNGYRLYGAIDLLAQFKDNKPVEQIAINKSKKIAYKCDLCKDNDKIACVNACPNEALRLVNPLEDKKEKNIKAALNLLQFAQQVSYL